MWIVVGEREAVVWKRCQLVGSPSLPGTYCMYIPTGYSTVMPVMLIHPLTSTSLSP